MQPKSSEHHTSFSAYHQMEPVQLRGFREVFSWQGQDISSLRTDTRCTRSRLQHMQSTQ
eukprot:jgi/Antlo1/1201/1955